ncbi:hypothetical protein Vretimale_14127 [Volvox reticuliferus]|uniref:Uncharacterized protein n=1 Tax=Volvox reticuliferus TaxID=1737510 RepID=A0A8J4FXH1_9CHLO|nr:hypothetical protein Vretifemale_16191 [Volvox reticuliferus]GIM10388.1 hypothetical protein Vretimale_14127 [Volvox reticuliferus]
MLWVTRQPKTVGRLSVCAKNWWAGPGNLDNTRKRCFASIDDTSCAIVNLMVPPPDRNLPAPCTGSPKPLPVASSEGLVYLIDCITALRGKHMAFLHGAAVDLQSRADALHAEAGKHAAAVADLVAMAAALEARQEILETRLSRIKLLHGNLFEWAGTLASLHWTMPRTMSLAEISATEELSGMEMRVKSLQRQWDISCEVPVRGASQSLWAGKHARHKHSRSSVGEGTRRGHGSIQWARCCPLWLDQP